MEAKEKIKYFIKLISEKNLQAVLNQFEVFCEEYGDYQAEIALKCLISGCSVAHKCFTGNDDNKALVEQLYKMCILCCNVLSKNWDIVKNNFISCTYHYCRYCLLLDEANYSITIAKYVTRHLKEAPHDLLNTEKEGLKGFVCIFTQNTELYHRFDSDIVCEFWCELFQISGYLQFDFMDKLIDSFAYRFVQLLGKEDVEHQSCPRFIQIVKIFVNIWNEFSFNALPEKIESTLCSFVKLLMFVYDHFLRSCKSVSDGFNILLSYIDDMEFDQKTPSVCALTFTVKMMKLMKSAFECNEEGRTIVKDEMFISRSKRCMLDLKHLRTTNSFFQKESLIFLRCVFCTSYNLAIELNHQENYKSSTLVCHRTLCLYCICDDMIILDDKELSFTVYSVVKILCDNLEQQLLYEEVLRIIALWTVLCPVQSAKFLTLFHEIKLKIIDKSLLDMTYYDFLITNKDKLLVGWPTILPQFDIDSLLTQELRLYMYRRNGCCKSVPWNVITETVRRLTEREFKSGDDYMKLLLCGRHSSHNDMDVEYSYKILPGIEIALNDLNKKYDPNAINERNVLYAYNLGNMYHLRFHLRLQKKRMEIKDRKDRYVNYISLKKIECHQNESVISAALSFDEQALIFADADEALKLWRKAFSNITLFKEKILSDTFESGIFIDNLIMLGFNYKKNCWFEKAISVFKFLFDVAATFGSDRSIVMAAEYLVDLQNDVEDELKNRVELSLPNVSSQKRLSYQLTVLKCELLKNPTFVYGKLKEMNTQILQSSPFLQAKYDFLLGRCELLQGNIFPDAFIALRKAYSTLVNCSRKLGSINDHQRLDCLFMDVSMFLGDCYVHVLRIPEARQIIYTCFEYVAILCSPFRLCHVLVLMAWCDAKAGDFDRCQTQLNLLERILGIEVPPTRKVEKRQFCFETVEMINLPSSSVVTDTEDSSLIREAVVSRRGHHQPSSLFVANDVADDKIRLSEFTLHPFDCICRRCGPFEYMRSVVQLSLLSFVYSSHSRMPTEQIDEYYAFVNKALVGTENGTYTTDKSLFYSDIVKYEVLRSECSALTSDFKSAMAFNNKAKRVVSSNYFGPLLYADVIEREICILSAMLTNENNEDKLDDRQGKNTSSLLTSPVVIQSESNNSTSTIKQTPTNVGSSLLSFEPILTSSSSVAPTVYYSSKTHEQLSSFSTSANKLPTRKPPQVCLFDKSATAGSRTALAKRASGKPSKSNPPDSSSYGATSPVASCSTATMFNTYLSATPIISRQLSDNKTNYSANESNVKLSVPGKTEKSVMKKTYSASDVIIMEVPKKKLLSKADTCTMSRRNRRIIPPTINAKLTLFDESEGLALVKSKKTNINAPCSSSSALVVAEKTASSNSSLKPISIKRPSKRLQRCCLASSNESSKLSTTSSAKNKSSESLDKAASLELSKTDSSVVLSLTKSSLSHTENITETAACLGKSSYKCLLDSNTTSKKKSVKTEEESAERPPKSTVSDVIPLNPKADDNDSRSLMPSASTRTTSSSTHRQQPSGGMKGLPPPRRANCEMSTVYTDGKSAVTKSKSATAKLCLSKKNPSTIDPLPVPSYRTTISTNTISTITQNSSDSKSSAVITSNDIVSEKYEREEERQRVISDSVKSISGDKSSILKSSPLHPITDNNDVSSRIKSPFLRERCVTTSTMRQKSSNRNKRLPELKKSIHRDKENVEITSFLRSTATKTTRSGATGNNE